MGSPLSLNGTVKSHQLRPNTSYQLGACVQVSSREEGIKVGRCPACGWRGRDGAGLGLVSRILWELQCRCKYGLWQLSSAAVPHSQPHPHPHPSISILRANPCSVQQQLHPLARNSKYQYPSRKRLMNKGQEVKGHGERQSQLQGNEGLLFPPCPATPHSQI